MEKLVIAASAKLEAEIKQLKEYFEENGYQVINYPKKININDDQEYKNTYIKYFESLKETDILFILNEDKNGIEGYIGAETFAELSFCIAQNLLNKENKQIYLLKKPSKEVACYIEIEKFINLGWIKIFKKEEY